MPLVRYLLEELRPLRFAEIRKGIPGITPRMLTRELRELEMCGVLVRRVSSISPLRVDYRLTTRGKALRPTLDAMLEWGKVDPHR
jgi:DNA-binding HxlR family transcriptional regulator